MNSREGVLDSATAKGVVAPLGGVWRTAGGEKTQDKSDVSSVSWFGPNCGGVRDGTSSDEKISADCDNFWGLLLPLQDGGDSSSLSGWVSFKGGGKVEGSSETRLGLGGLKGQNKFLFWRTFALSVHDAN